MKEATYIGNKGRKTNRLWDEIGLIRKETQRKIMGYMIELMDLYYKLSQIIIGNMIELMDLYYKLSHCMSLYHANPQINQNRFMGYKNIYT